MPKKKEKGVVPVRRLVVPFHPGRLTVMSRRRGGRREERDPEKRGEKTPDHERPCRPCTHEGKEKRGRGGGGRPEFATPR